MFNSQSKFLPFLAGDRPFPSFLDRQSEMRVQNFDDNARPWVLGKQHVNEQYQATKT